MNDPVLAADASVRLIVVNSIPNTVAQRQSRAQPADGCCGDRHRRARHDLRPVRATAASTQLPARRGGDAVLFGEYLVADVQLTAVKSQTILDQFGGARPLPGARINYQIVVTPSGTGTATAAAFSDLVPANTTYVAGSLQLNGAALSDAADADAGTFVSAPAPEVRVTLGDLTRRFRAADDRVRRDHQLRVTRQEKGR